MISIVALIPGGLVAYQQASSSTAQAQIIQNVTTQLELIGIANLPATTNYYFNADGSQVLLTDPTLLYTAAVTISAEGTGAAPGTSPVVLTALSASVADKINILVTSKSQALQTNNFSTVIAY